MAEIGVPLVSHLNSDLFHGICPAPFTSSLELLSYPGPGLGAPLSSYLEVNLHFNVICQGQAFGCSWNELPDP